MLRACRPSLRLAARRAPALLFKRLLATHPNPDGQIAHQMQADGIPHALARRVAALDTLQTQFEELEQVQERKLRELERQFHDLSQHILDRRAAIVSGSAEPTDEEVAASNIRLGDVEAQSEDELEPVEPGVSNFWLEAMLQCDALKDPGQPLITEKDMAVLQYLEDVRATPWVPPSPSWNEFLGEDDVPDDLEEGPTIMGDDQDMGFALHFHFSQDNPFFRADEPLSLYCYRHGEVAQVAPETIEWANDRDPTVQTTTKKKKNRRTGQVVYNEKVTKVSSFFNIFTLLDADISERELAMSEKLIEETSITQERVALAMRETLVPHATAYYIQSLVEHEGGAEDNEFAQSIFDDDMPGRRGR